MHHGELEPGTDASQVVEAGARHFRAALHVDCAEQLPDLEVVARGEVEFGLDALGAQHDVVVLAAGRHVVEDDVLDLAHRIRERRLGLVRARLRIFDLRREFLHGREQRGALLLRRLADLLRARVLFGAQRLVALECLASRRVRRNRLVNGGRVVAAGRLRTLDYVGGLSQELNIDHPAMLSTSGNGCRAAPVAA